MAVVAENLSHIGGQEHKERGDSQTYCGAPPNDWSHQRIAKNHGCGEKRDGQCHIVGHPGTRGGPEFKRGYGADFQRIAAAPKRRKPFSRPPEAD